MSGVDDALFPPPQVCRRQEHRAKPGEPNVWESRPNERANEAGARKMRARVLCLSCPALEWCEQRLVEHEVAGKHIDGVVAARLSDVKLAAYNDYQDSCLGCGRRLVAMRAWTQSGVHGENDHVGEGLCRHCYPVLARANRLTPLGMFGVR